MSHLHRHNNHGNLRKFHGNSLCNHGYSCSNHANIVTHVVTMVTRIVAMVSHIVMVSNIVRYSSHGISHSGKFIQNFVSLKDKKFLRIRQPRSKCHPCRAEQNTPIPFQSQIFPEAVTAPQRNCICW